MQIATSFEERLSRELLVIWAEEIVIISSNKNTFLSLFDLLVMDRRCCLAASKIWFNFDSKSGDWQRSIFVATNRKIEAGQQSVTNSR